jgi:hypothetical protein
MLPVIYALAGMKDCTRVGPIQNAGSFFLWRRSKHRVVGLEPRRFWPRGRRRMACVQTTENDLAIRWAGLWALRQKTELRV